MAVRTTLVWVGFFLAGFSLFAGDAVWVGNVTNAWDTSTQNWTRNGTPSQAYQDGDDVTFDNSAVAFTVTGSVTNAPTSVLVSNTTTYTISASIGGVGGVTKAGSGTLTLSGSNTYSGGSTLSGGTLWVTSDSNLGEADAPVTFDGSATLRNDNGAGDVTIDLGARSITLTNGATATFKLGRGDGFNTTGAVIGDGGVFVSAGGGNYSYLRLLNVNNTFTGPIRLNGGNSLLRVVLNSFADSTNAISFEGGNVILYYEGAEDLVLSNRTVILSGSGTIDNSSGYGLTLDAPILGGGTGARTLTLAGGSGGEVGGDISDGPATLSLSKSGGTWSLSGSNTYSGATTLEAGTLAILGRPAMAPGTRIVLKRSTTLSIRTDDAGRVSLGNPFGVAPIDTSTGVISHHSIDVRNNGGGTAGSTIVLGTVDLATGDMRANRQIDVYGSNGYILQVGNVEMNTALRGTATGGPNRFNPSSAPIIIAGTVKQLSGDTGASTTDNNLYLGGVMAGNVVSGTIADADDYPANTNASPLNVYKGDSGEWTLSGTNTYSGTTTVKSGSLRIMGSLGTGSVVTVSNNGSVIGTLGGTGSVGGSVVLSGTGSIDLRDGSVGTFVLGSDLSIGGALGANDLTFDLGTGTNGTDKITVAGDVTMATSGAGVITLLQLSGTRIDAGTYDLIDCAGALPAVSDFTLATTAAFGNTFSLQVTGSRLQLVVTGPPPAPAAAFWTGGGVDDNWSTLANWATDASGLTPLSAAPGFETDLSLYAAGAVRLTSATLDADFDVNSLTYTVDAIANTTIGDLGKTLILEAGSGTGVMVNTPVTNSPTHTINADVALATSQAWTVGSNASLTVAGVVSDFGGGHALTKGGDGTLRLSGLNTYSGPTTVDGGTLEIWHLSVGNVTVPNPLGMSSADPANLLLNPGTTLEFITSSDAPRYTDRGFTINGSAPGDSATLFAGGAGNKGVSLTYSGSPAYGTPDQSRILILDGTIATSGGNYDQGYELAASIADNGTGAVSLIKNGTGAWQLLGTSSYSGGTTINGGSLRMFVANALPSSGTVTLADVSGALLSLDNRNQSIGALAGGGSSGGNIKLGSATLTVGDSSSTTYAGTISGSGGLTKQGSGTLTLAASNTYSGTTTVNAGTLQLAADGALGAGPVVLSGGSLDMGAFDNAAGTLDVSSGSTIALRAGHITFADSSAETWTGTLTLTGNLGNHTLRVGMDENALTPDQLDRINHDGIRVEITADGYLQSGGGSVFIVR